MSLIMLVLHLSAYLALIMLQPDAGSAMVFCFMFIVLMFIAGLSFKIIIPTAVLGAASMPVIYKFMLGDYQRHRINVFMNPEMDPLGNGYNVIQSKIAVGSGGLFGKGYLQGTCKNEFGRFTAAGVGAMLLFHTAENVGMCIGLMPVTGIPLPFFSYGGTSMLTNLVAIGLVLSVSRRNKGTLYL